MDLNRCIAEKLGIRTEQASAAIRLLEEGNTVPFIARYRKEATGALNDEQLRELSEQLTYLKNLQEKKETALHSIEEQGKLTPELKKQLEEAMTLAAVEDLYRPYKQKRRTRAGIAREKGLEPLAQFILEQQTDRPVEKEAEKYITEEVASANEAIAGAMDILAEQFDDNAQYRAEIRERIRKSGILKTVKREQKTAQKTDGEPVNKKLQERADVYDMYADYSEAVSKIPGHRILAINRGENEKLLTVRLEAPEEEILGYLKKQIIRGGDEVALFGKKIGTPLNPYTTPILEKAIEDSYRRLTAPSVEREIQSSLTEKAEDGAIEVFGKNLQQLLMQPPISGHTVLGWDPAFRTGCKIAVIDPTGKVLDTTVVYPTEPQRKVAETKKTIEALIERYGVDLISLGNGTASRESEQVIAEIIREVKKPLQYIIVNEAGASVYSASKLGTEEFPEFDVGQRSAASMARRLQDPMAELVKIDPKSVGVGQYQHDMDQKKLDAALTAVVENCVNRVGVDLNTASWPLLSYISGISKPLAKNIVAYREANGRFASRRELLKVPKLGPKAYEQCAGFLRIRGGVNPLDATGVHPESYEAAEKLLKGLGLTIEDPAVRHITKLVKDSKKTAQELGIGEWTLEDILKELETPGRDPRSDMPLPILRSDVLSMEDLKEGMKLKGTVRNIVDFGVFVDIGVHQDGLVHISRITDRYIKHPMEAVSVGDIVDVTVLSIDLKKKRISLSMVEK